MAVNEPYILPIAILFVTAKFLIQGVLAANISTITNHFLP